MDCVYLAMKDLPLDDITLEDDFACVRKDSA